MAAHNKDWSVKLIREFHKKYGKRVKRGLRGTPYPLSMIYGILIQETGYVWSNYLRRGFSDEKFFELCIADQKTFGKGRREWPKTKSELLSKDRGDEVFRSVRRALEARVNVVGGSLAAFARNPNNILMGYGPWQYDIGFVQWASPEFFIERHWRSLETCQALLLKELEARRKGLRIKPQNLSLRELSIIATAYNRGLGRYKPSLGLRQGPVTQGQYYGERVNDFIMYAREVTGERFPNKRMKATA